MEEPPKHIDLGPDEYRVKGQRPSEWWENPPEVSFMGGLVRLCILVGSIAGVGLAATWLRSLDWPTLLVVCGVIVGASVLAAVWLDARR